MNLANGLGFTIYQLGETKGLFIKPEQSRFPIDVVAGHLDFFNSLKQVELLYRIRFAEIGQYTETDFDNVYKAIAFANGKDYIQLWDQELVWELSPDTTLDMLLEIEKGAHFVAESQTVEVIKIYDQAIELGYRLVEPLNLYIENLDEVINKRTSKVVVKSKSKQIRICYKNSLSKKIKFCSCSRIYTVANSLLPNIYAQCHCKLPTPDKNRERCLQFIHRILLLQLHFLFTDTETFFIGILV